ncbi:MAG TPA: DUF362 domain-containing protein [Candidatus Binatia bacterium]|nr:DUF362 domain-containing protein [Candidatus Binatia bacterium]
MRRRAFLKYSALSGALYSVTAACDRSPKWQRDALRKKDASRVAILSAARYDQPLRDVILRGIQLCGLGVKGKKILLKPNLVEFDPKGVINTNPAVIEAAVDAFRSLGAAQVTVAEGPGHRRDNEYLLSASGLYDVIKEHRVSYIDLNTDDVRATPLRSRFTDFKQLYLPESLYDADVLVSMPKLKTHHWAGVTLSLKNMFGVVPGVVYGWPKNILHWQGINNSILDINSSLPLPQFAIIDGIVGMEGNGPLQGQPKNSGVLIFGDDLVAVDATAARLMTLEPQKIDYLAKAAEFLGNLDQEKIHQVGERIDALRQDFAVIEDFQKLKKLTS